VIRSDWFLCHVCTAKEEQAGRKGSGALRKKDQKVKKPQPKEQRASSDEEREERDGCEETAARGSDRKRAKR
jgi:hypothetical protein